MSESEYSSPILSLPTDSEGDLADYQGDLIDHLEAFSLDTVHLIQDHSPPGGFS
jgi:hypothetical protein